MSANERRPAGAASEASRPDLSVTASTDTRPTLDASEVYQIIRGRLAAHVIVKDVAGRIVCRSYANLRAAERAVERAHSRGCAATIVMVRQDVAPLVPVRIGGLG